MPVTTDSSTSRTSSSATSSTSSTSSTTRASTTNTISRGSIRRGAYSPTRTRRIIYGQAIEYKLTKDMKAEWTANVNYTKRDAYSQSLVGSDVRVMTDSRLPGTHEGVFDAGAYTSKIWTRGEEWSLAREAQHPVRLQSAASQPRDFSSEGSTATTTTSAGARSSIRSSLRTARSGSGRSPSTTSPRSRARASISRTTSTASSS